MDRPIDPTIPAKARRKKIIVSAVILFGITAVLVFVFDFVKPSEDRSRLRFAVVRTGSIEASLSATGTVAPEYEQVISSPVESRVLKVLKKTGEPVKKGEKILLLDIMGAQNEFDKMHDQFLLKKNAMRKLELELQNTLTKLDNEIKVKRLEVQIANAKFEQTQKLFDKAIASKNELQQSELESKRTQLALDQLIQTRENSGNLTTVQIEGLQIEIDILNRDMESAEKTVKLASTTAEQDGVITWVLQQEGTTVRKGDLLAKVANLTTFEVKGSISDIHSSRLSLGQMVKVKIDTTYLAGNISNIEPNITNGIMNFRIALDDKSNKNLRSSLRVDVAVITDYKHSATLVKRGSFSSTGGMSYAFVVNDDRAEKRMVRFGLSNFDDIEIAEGLTAGETVIISNTDNFKDYNQINIK